MCFSAEASFGMSAILCAGGVVSLRKVSLAGQIPFASIPLVFSIQQFFEGFVWISLTHASWSFLQMPFTILFLIWAQVIWPAWVPFSFYLLEKDPFRKKVLALMLLLGLMVAFFLAYCLYSLHFHSSINNHHIKYDLDFAQILGSYNSIFYFIPTVIPPFISGNRKMMVIGLFNLGSFMISKFFFRDHLVSVWCFFAAGISIMIVWMMNDYRKRQA